jgi:hypothetical protein
MPYGWRYVYKVACTLYTDRQVHEGNENVSIYKGCVWEAYNKYSTWWWNIFPLKMEEDKDICFYYFYPMFLFFLGFFFFAGLGLELRAYTLSYSTSPVLRFFFFFFWERVLWTIFLGWLWTMILLISASWVARITRWATGAQLYVLFCFWRHWGLNSGPHTC